MVGPTTKTKSISSTANSTLVVESHLMPRCSPEKAETTKARVSAPITTSCTVVVFRMPATRSSPAATWSAPRPRLVAEPNTVAKTASRSIARPIGPSARRPSTGRKAAEIRFSRPLRKVEYASASATTA